MKYSGHRKLLSESPSDTVLVYKHRPERTGFNMYAEYMQQQFSFLASLAWAIVKLRNFFCVHEQHFRNVYCLRGVKNLNISDQF